MYSEIINFIKSLYPDQNPVPLHAPVFFGNEKKYINDCIDSTFVSYVGKYVTQFEEMTAKYTGAKYAVAVVNGTAALQISLQIAGVKSGDEVITQPLTFVATANAIKHCGANPVFVDVDKDTMGLSPEKLDDWLSKNVEMKENDSSPIGASIHPFIHSSGSETSKLRPLNKSTGKVIAAIVPMHTFGFPCLIDEIVEVANKYNIPVIEDSAESLGSFYKGRHTGTFGLAGIFSYNGNKTITTGGGGMIITDNEELAKRAKHITTTAKIPHKWDYVHDEIAYNYRLTNVSAALGVAQMEYFDKILQNKRETADLYKNFCKKINLEFFSELQYSSSNYWLNVVLLKNIQERDKFLEETNTKGVMTRPIWRLMNKLEMFKNCQLGNLENAEWLEDRVVNIPSGFRG